MRLLYKDIKNLKFNNETFKCSNKCKGKYKHIQDTFNIYMIKTNEAKYIVAKCTVCDMLHVLAEEKINRSIEK